MTIPKATLTWVRSMKLEISAESGSWLGDNKDGNKQLRWNTGEIRANKIMAQYGRKAQFSVHEMYFPHIWNLFGV